MQSAYNVAFADFFHAPEINEIDSSNYTTQAGSLIRIDVMDDFKVKSVHVRIERADASLVEQGDATEDPDGIHWNYTATIANTSLAGCKIIVTARDFPGNSIVQQKTI